MSEANNYKIITLDTAAPDTAEAKILLIYTGGTLGMGHDENGTLVPIDFSDLLSQAPVLGKFSLEVTIVAFNNPIDSSDILPVQWNGLAEIINKFYDDHDGFVIIHGTDTMAFTASALSFILEGLSKPVILTGAQLPITSIRTDALENLVTALEIASAKNEKGDAAVPEVCIYFNNKLLRGNRSQKVQSDKFHAFNSANYPALADSGIEIEYHYAYIHKPGSGIRLTNEVRFDNNVTIVKLFPGICKESLEPVLRNLCIKGVVLETYGSGNVMSEKWFIDLLKETIDRGVIVLNVSQCMGGRVTQGRYKTSEMLDKIGVINGFDLTTEAAITKLMFTLGKNLSYESTIECLILPVSGEMTRTNLQ
ncbi:MAG: asparaginase [Bacteroidota bacterium]